MRLDADEPHRTHLRRSSLVMLVGGAFASLVLALLLPSCVPWLGTPHAPTLIVTSGAVMLAASAWLACGSRAEWTTIDELAWIVSLVVFALLTGSSDAPFGVQALLQLGALLVLAVLSPSPLLSIVASATAAFVPVVRALLVPNLGAVISSAFVATGTTAAFLALSVQSRRLVLASARTEPATATTVRSALTGSPASTRAARVVSAGADETRVADSTERGWDGLVERVRASITTMAQNAGVAATVRAEIGGLAPPSTKFRSSLLRIAQEAATQAIRHAESRSILITLRRGDGGVVLELHDEATSSDGTRQRRSLASLRARIAALGGTADVRRSDTGWVTRVRLPCEQLN